MQRMKAPGVTPDLPGFHSRRCGWARPRVETLSLPALAFAGEGRTLVGSYMGSAAPQRDVPRYVALWKAGRLPVDRLQSASLPLERINEAFETLAVGNAVRQVLLPHA